MQAAFAPASPRQDLWNAQAQHADDFPTHPSLSRPASSTSQRRPSVSATVVTSAISDEEEDDDYSQDEDASADQHSDGSHSAERSEEEGEHQEEPAVTAQPRSATARSATRTKAAQDSLRVPRPALTATAPVRQEVEKAAPTLSASELTRAVSEVPALSGGAWRQRLRWLKEQLVQHHSRGERIALAHDSAFLDAAGEDEETNPLPRSSSFNAEAKEQPTVRAHGRARSEASRTAHRTQAHHRSITSSNIPHLAPFDAASSTLTAFTTRAPLSSTLPSASALPSTARSTISAAFAAKYSAFAKDLEGMEQERRELLRDKRRLLALIAQHHTELQAVQEEWQRADERLLALAKAKGMTRVGEGTNSRFEPRAQLEDGRLNPALSTAQLVLGLQRDIAALEKEKEEKEVRQDELEEEERRREEEERKNRGSGDGEEGEDYGEEDEQGMRVTAGLSGRRRLRALRERKRLLLEKLHAMQDQLLATRQRPHTAAGRDSARLAQLEADCRRLRLHNDEYRMQRDKAVQRLERSAAALLHHPTSHTAAAVSRSVRSSPSHPLFAVYGVCVSVMSVCGLTTLVFTSSCTERSRRVSKRGRKARLQLRSAADGDTQSACSSFTMDWCLGPRFRASYKQLSRNSLVCACTRGRKWLIQHTAHHAPSRVEHG